MSDKPQKQMKGFGRKLLSRRRHLSFARAAIGRNKSGILPPGSTTSDADAMPKYCWLRLSLYMIGITKYCLFYLDIKSELRPRELRIVLLADSREIWTTTMLLHAEMAESL